MTLPFRLAATIATTVTGVAVLLRGTGVLSLSGVISSDALPLLVAGAALCTAGLLRLRSPSLAWPALVIAVGLAALEVVGTVRSWQGTGAASTWPWLVIFAEAALLAAAVVAAAYVTRPRVGERAEWRLIRRFAVAPALVALILVAGWAVLESFAAVARSAPATDAWPLRVSGRLCAAFVGVSLLLGASRDLIGPLQRARRRAPTLLDLPRTLADELLPTAAALHRGGREAERARLAADLHALVLPELRRAAAFAEASGSAGEPVAVGLRGVVDDVERLIDARQSIVLEEYGLVAALEWLAERTQQRSSIQVDIDLAGTGLERPDSIPETVVRAAYRVALLALDNVVRHAQATRALVDLTVTDGRLRLAIDDDGRGIDLRRALTGRGVRDMRQAASDVGGAVTIERLGRGTRVELTWKAPDGAPPVSRHDPPRRPAR
jgi:signal transduction histidine kinase